MGNFTFILLLGPILEEKYGSGLFAFLMLITAAVIGFTQALLFSGFLIGASGLVFMMIIMVSFTNIRKGELPVTMILVALLFLTKEIINALSPVENNISEMAHIAGGICGIVFGFLIHGSDEKKPETPAAQDPSL
jgi:membrane associated rhomboid family serine protease